MLVKGDDQGSYMMQSNLCTSQLRSVQLIVVIREALQSRGKPTWVDEPGAAKDCCMGIDCWRQPSWSSSTCGSGHIWVS